MIGDIGDVREFLNELHCADGVRVIDELLERHKENNDLAFARHNAFQIDWKRIRVELTAEILTLREEKIQAELDHSGKLLQSFVRGMEQKEKNVLTILEEIGVSDIEKFKAAIHGDYSAFKNWGTKPPEPDRTPSDENLID